MNADGLSRTKVFQSGGRDDPNAWLRPGPQSETGPWCVPVAMRVPGDFPGLLLADNARRDDPSNKPFFDRLQQNKIPTPRLAWAYAMASARKVGVGSGMAWVCGLVKCGRSIPGFVEAGDAVWIVRFEDDGGACRQEGAGPPGEALVVGLVRNDLYCPSFVSGDEKVFFAWAGDPSGPFRFTNEKNEVLQQAWVGAKQVPSAAIFPFEALKAGRFSPSASVPRQMRSILVPRHLSTDMIERQTL